MSDLSETVWLSCPFCGEADQCTLVHVAKPRYRVECNCCGARGPARPGENSARRAWNTRVSVWPAEDDGAYGTLSLEDREKFYWEE